MKLKTHKEEPIYAHINRHGDTLYFDLSYPTVRGIKVVEFNIEDVRSSDGIRIEYDYERDGYAIFQSYEINEEEDEWIEVGFFRSWALEHLNYNYKDKN